MELPMQKEKASEKTCFCADQPSEALNIDSSQPHALPEKPKPQKLLFLEPKNKRQKKSKHDENAEILDVFHPEGKICSVFKTNTTTKPNVFASFRPEVGAVLDYTISQTDAKLDAGATKIHYQQTEAHYDWVPDFVPSSPLTKRRAATKKKKILNIEDIEKMRNDAIEASLVAFRKELKTRFKKQKTLDRIALLYDHNDALRRVGPEWFQELSPNQIKTVDNLKHAMLRDYQINTYENTYESIKSLGVYLRPNHRYIQIALKECCKCPVEFLLIIYQMIDPKRTRYSINDRLLLSAAAHLTLTDTLRELHVRIPSPPRLVETTVQIKEERKKLKYESPYLEPYTFEPEPRKWHGIYRNKHVQRPESPYFAYLEKFREDLATAPDAISGHEDLEGMSEVEKEILEELKAAQQVYEDLVEFRPVPKLLKPSVYSRCVNMRLKKEKMLAEQKLLEVIDKIEAPPAPDLGAVFDALCRHCQNTYKDKIKEMGTVGGFDETTQTCTEKTCDEGEVEQVEQVCDACESGKEEADAEHACGKEAPSSEANATSENVCGHEGNGENPCQTCDADEIEATTPEEKDKLVRKAGTAPKQPVTGQVVKEKEDCECKVEVQKVIDAPQCTCERCIEDRKKKVPMVIAGLSEPPVDQGVLPVIEGVYSRQCSCLKKYQDAVQRFEDYQAKMKAIGALKRLQHKYIINGVVNTPDGPVFNIIGLRPQIDCICAKTQRREAEENARLAAMPNAPPGRIKFGIVGTKETEAGNVYILSGALPIDDCDCMKLYNKYEDKHATCLKLWENYLKQMQGNIDDYMEDMGIDTELAANEDIDEEDERTNESLSGQKMCKCGAFIVKKPPCQPPPCMPPPCSFPTPCMQPPPCMPPPCSFPTPCMPPPPCQPLSCTPPPCSPPWPCMPPPPCQPPPCMPPPCSFPTPCMPPPPCQPPPCTPPPCSPPWPCTPPPSCMPPPCSFPSPCMPPPCQPFPSCAFSPCMPPCPAPNPCGCRKAVDCDTCDCGVQQVTDVVCEDCTCAPPPELENRAEPESEPKPSQFKRFVILDKIPCRLRLQMAVLKQALASMAEDDFPLAKLPDVHRLPHFKLWMQMRCGKYWTQEDRYDYIRKSRRMWKHTDICKRPLKTPDLGMSKHAISELIWTQAVGVKNRIKKIKFDYERTVRQDMVNFGREFFPTMFDYEFPTPAFRDCYFAYTPAKEEEVISMFVWGVFEVKNFTRRQSCSCN